MPKDRNIAIQYGQASQRSTLKAPSMKPQANPVKRLSLIHYLKADEERPKSCLTEETTLLIRHAVHSHQYRTMFVQPGSVQIDRTQRVRMPPLPQVP